MMGRIFINPSYIRAYQNCNPKDNPKTLAYELAFAEKRAKEKVLRILNRQLHHKVDAMIDLFDTEKRLFATCCMRCEQHIIFEYNIINFIVYTNKEMIFSFVKVDDESVIFQKDIHSIYDRMNPPSKAICAHFQSMI
jgi:hypothetical protein